MISKSSVQGSGASPASRDQPLPFWPREHGFWAMLIAVLLAAVLRAPLALDAFIAAVVVAVVAATAGGFAARAVRRSGSAQVVSAAAIAVLGVPVELVGGASAGNALAAASAWIPILSGSALVVRAAFARAARGKQQLARSLDAAAVGLPGAACAVSALAGWRAEAMATGLAAIGCAALVVLQPGVKRMKQVGLALAGLAAVAAIALGK